MDKQERKNIKKLIKQYVHFNQYGIFTPFVREIVEQRYNIFGYLMSDDRIKEELDALAETCKRIRFARNDEYVEGSNTAGYFSSTDKEIVLFGSRMGFAAMLYDILTHEIFHALSCDKDDCSTGLKYYIKGEKVPIGVALNESFNEYGAYMQTTHNREFMERAFGVHTLGYEDITFAPRLLSAVFGIPEKTVVGEGLKNRGSLFEGFERVLKSVKGGKNKTKIEFDKDEFDKFEDNLNVIFNLDFNEGKLVGIDKKTKDDMRKEAIENIINYGYEQLRKTIEAQTSTIELGGGNEATEKFAYCYYKLENICYELVKQVRDDNERFRLTQDIMKRRGTYGKQVVDIYKVTKDGERHNNRLLLKEELRKVVEGELVLKNDSRDDQIGRVFNKEEILSTSEFAQFMKKEDYDEIEETRKPWVIEGIELLRKRDIITRYFSKVVEDIKRNFNNQKKLPEGNNTSKEDEKKEFVEGLKVQIDENKKEKKENNSLNSVKEDIVKDEENKEL